MSIYTRLDDKVIELDNKFPVGSVYVTSTNDNPQSYLGGEWEFIDKRLKYMYLIENNTEDTFFTNTNCSQWNIAMMSMGDAIWLRGSVYPAVDLSDTTTYLGHIDFSKMGINSPWQLYTIGFSDGGNGIAFLSIYDDGGGNLRVVDCMNVSGGHTIAAGQQIAFQAVQPCGYDSNGNKALDNNYCDKFYWKRIG